MVELYRCIERCGSLAEVQHILDSGANIDYMSLECGYQCTTLHEFCWSYCNKSGAETLQILKLLLEKGADVNALDRNRRTPLTWLVERAFPPDHVALLLNKGADINHRNMQGETALHRFSFIDETKIGSCSLRLLEFLIENGADIDCEDSDGWTPLIWFMELGLPHDHIELLLKKGADLSHKDPVGKKYPVLHACVHRCTDNDLTRMLCEYGAEIHWQSKWAGEVVALYATTDDRKGLVCETIFKFALLRDDTALNGFLDNPVEDVGRSKLRRFVDAALKELAKMRTTRLNGGVTVRGFVLETDARRLGGYFSKDDNLEARFPIYADVIRSRLETARHWAETVRKLDTISLTSVVCNSGVEVEIALNRDCIRHVARFLTDDDLETFISACRI